MKKQLGWVLGAFLFFLSLSFLPFSLNAAQEAPGMPSLVIIGGSLRYDNAEVFNKMIELAGGAGAKIAVFPTASSSPVKNGQQTVDAFKRYGADAILMPIALKNIDVDYKVAVNDPVLIAQVKSADGIYFIGGDQARITQALYTETGDRTPMLDAIWEVLNRGGMIGGSSAGAAIMSTTMFKNSVDVLSTMKVGVKEGGSIDKGLGFIGSEVFVDQHFLTRGRFARALVAMQAKGYKLGIGVDENTALVVFPTTGTVDVIGYKGALVLDLAETTTDVAVPQFNLRNAKLTYLDRGDQFNLKTKTVTLHPDKLNDVKVDTNDPKYEPYFTEELFAADILENTAVVDLMANLIDNSHKEAIGLAFTQAVDVPEPDLGFEFKFYKQSDSLGYYTGTFGGEDYSVENVHLDITPIQMGQPLYKKL
ncbi:MAG: cyanophycinase [Drouetiella hepatica Uher 2000/2452]|jgi:cyanophycinase|uniref:Cyanophycinase n=1 Tax=Drouetiella hepatica Uher 2000/2452 TaxID=904376 RepID=A0A951Q7Z7_9CYAN|nr:cyanophycinase [Drouetiella hepatica Uher 2000/2452]